MSHTVQSASSTCIGGTPGTATENRTISRVRSVTPASGPRVVEEDRERARRAGHDEPPAGDGLARLGGAQAQAALDRRGVERPHRHVGLHHRDRDRVVERVAAAEAAVLHALERQRLDRDPLLVGLEPDVAEEDPVGVRDRLLAQRDRLRPAEAVRQQPQPLLAAPAGSGRARTANVIEASRSPGHSCASSAATSPSTSGGSLTGARSAASRAAAAARRPRSAPATCPRPRRPRRRT